MHYSPFFLVIYSFSLTVHAFSCFSQVPVWSWAKSAGGNYEEYSYGVTTDGNNNLFITGNFNSNTFNLGTYTLTNTYSDSMDIFLAKLDGSGSVLWAKSAGGSPTAFGDYVTGIATDADGNVIITGWYLSPYLIFDSYGITNTQWGRADIFIAKYDSNGNLLWAKNAGGTNDDKAISVDADDSGNVIITGWFNSYTIDFDTITLNQSGWADIFIAKYNASGNLLWAKRAGGNDYDEGTSIASDDSGNIFVSGNFESTTLTFGSYTLNNTGNLDIFIVKYDLSGNVLWAKSADGSYYDYGNSIAADIYGNVFITGFFMSGVLTFGPFTLTNVGNEDIFIAKYDASGNILWAKGVGGSYYDYGRSITSDVNGNILIAGHFTSPTLTFGSNTLTNAGNADVFIVKYDSSGNELWAKSAGGSSDDFAYGIIADANGNITITGDFSGANLAIGTDTLPNNGSFDIFIAQLSGVTGMAENSLISNPAIYPNPASEEFSLLMELSGSYDFEIKVVNILGQVVYGNKFAHYSSKYKKKLNVGNLSKGIYSIQIITAKEIICKQIIIQ